MRAAEHPLYRDDAAVGRGTLEHVQAGRTIFQMFQFGASEAEHAARMLELVDPPAGGSVLSLGCGVGGMERYWQLRRPDLSFELVNISAAQLDLCACEGERVLADAEGYVSPRGPFDVVVLAYMLGHVDARATLHSAMANLKPEGLLLVADCFDSEPEFDWQMHYDSPKLDAVREQLPWIATWRDLKPVPFIAEALPNVQGLTRPAVILAGASGA